MKKEFFVRFTKHIKTDIRRGTSINTNTGEVIKGLCAFPGKDSIEDTLAKAHRIGRFVAEPGDTFYVLKAYQDINEKSGSLGVVIMTDGIEIIEKGKIR